MGPGVGLCNSRSGRMLASHLNSMLPPFFFPHHCRPCPLENYSVHDEDSDRASKRMLVIDFLFHLFFMFSLSYS